MPETQWPRGHTDETGWKYLGALLVAVTLECLRVCKHASHAAYQQRTIQRHHEVQEIIKLLLLVRCLGYHLLSFIFPVETLPKWLHNAVHSWCLVSAVFDPPQSTGEGTSHLTVCKHYDALWGNHIHQQLPPLFIINDVRNLCWTFGTSITGPDCWTIRSGASNRMFYTHTGN